MRRVVGRELGEPESVGAQGFGVHGRGVELGGLAGGVAEEDDAAEFGAAGEALEGVLAGQAIEDGIDAFAAGQFPDAIS